jgi:translation initiation factor IF-3
MRITHRRKKPKPKKVFHYNEGITVPKVMVLDVAGKNIGEMKVADAIALAREQELDLVEINPKSNPPVAKIADFGQFRYNQEKEARLAKARQHVVEIKGVRLSLRIGKHDLEIRKKQSVKFLNDGDKVKLEIILRGREFQHIPRGLDLLRDFVKEINEVEEVRLEQEPQKEGNKLTAIIAKA